MATSFNTAKPLDTHSYQQKIDRPLLISTGVVTVVGLAVAIIGGLALAGVYYPHVNVLGTLALMGKAGAISMIAGGSAIAGLALTFYCCKKGIESNDPYADPTYVPKDPQRFTSRVTVSEAEKLYDNAEERMAIQHHCKNIIKQDTLVVVIDKDNSTVLYQVNITKNLDESLQYEFLPGGTNISPSIPQDAIMSIVRTQIQTVSNSGKGASGRLATGGHHAGGPEQGRTGTQVNVKGKIDEESAF